MLHRDPPSFSHARCRPASTSALLYDWSKAQLFASAELSCWRNWEQRPWLKVSGNIYLSKQVLQCLGTSLEHAPDPALIPHLACPLSHLRCGAAGAVRAVSTPPGQSSLPRWEDVAHLSSKVLWWKEKCAAAECKILSLKRMNYIKVLSALEHSW